MSASSNINNFIHEKIQTKPEICMNQTVERVWFMRNALNQRKGFTAMVHRMLKGVSEKIPENIRNRRNSNIRSCSWQKPIHKETNLKLFPNYYIYLWKKTHRNLIFAKHSRKYGTQHFWVNFHHMFFHFNFTLRLKVFYLIGLLVSL